MLRVNATKAQLVKALGNRKLVTVNESCGYLALDFSFGDSIGDSVQFTVANGRYSIETYYVTQQELLISMNKLIERSVTGLLTGNKNYHLFLTTYQFPFYYYFYFLRFEFFFNTPRADSEFEYIKVTKRKIDGIDIDFEPVVYNNINRIGEDDDDNDRIIFHHWEALSEYNRIMNGE